MANRGILLVNLGSPDSPSVSDVRRYLNEFLMDKYVIDLPWFVRRLIVSLFVLPSRPAKSAKAYQSIWTEDGSPLVQISKAFAQQIQSHTNMPVELAMRYGKPDLKTALINLNKNTELEEILLFPLYPHYAMSTIKTVVEKVESLGKILDVKANIRVHPIFYDHQDYIQALVDSAEPQLSQPYDHLVFSYHGVPERHIKKDDNTGSHCLQSKDCCQKASTAHKTCYRHQVYQTTECFVKAADIPVDKYTVAFQSRLGKDKWLEPNTLDILEKLAKQGNKRVLVICPSFVADCLETLEEIGIAAQESFINAGGESLELIPCLNTHPSWVKTVSGWLEQPLIG